MNRLGIHSYILLFFLTPLISRAQEQLVNGVTIHADPRLAILLKKYPVKTAEATPVKIAEKTERDTSDANTAVVMRTPVVLYHGKGFRVQVYSGVDREKAQSIKADLMRRFPGVHTYMTFVAPSYRIKMGDYRSRALAEAMLKQVNTIYPPCMIVPDEITITGYQ